MSSIDEKRVPGTDASGRIFRCLTTYVMYQVILVTFIHTYIHTYIHIGEFLNWYVMSMAIVMS